MATRNLGTMSDSVLQDYHTRRHTSGLNTEELEAPLALVHSTSRINWLTARYDPDDSQRLQLLATGEGGFEELLGSLDDNLVIYGCFMFAAANQVKCAFVSWVGEGVSGLERARVSMHRSDMQAFVQPVASFDIQEREVPAALSAAVKASIATQVGASLLSYDGLAHISLDTNNIEAEREESAEEVHGRSELEPLPSAPPTTDADTGLLEALWAGEGLPAARAAALAKEVPQSLLGEVLWVWGGHEQLTPEAAAGLLSAASEEAAEAAEAAPHPGEALRGEGLRLSLCLLLRVQMLREGDCHPRGAARLHTRRRPLSAPHLQ